MILGVAMVRNEADIVEPFVRHNLRYVDALRVVEHGSVDGTAEILKALSGEGLAVDVREQRTRGYDQEKILTAVVREEPEARAFVFLDADEFIHGVSPESFRAQVEAMPDHSVALAPWRTYLPLVYPAADIVRCMTFRRKQERPRYYKAVLCPRAGVEYAVQLGAHDVDATMPVGKVVVKGLFYAHYPVRSPAQMELKSIVGWLGYALREHSRGNQGRQWKECFRRVVEHGGFSWEDMPDVSMRYAQKICDWSAEDVVYGPLEYTYQRKYDHLRTAVPVLGLVAKTMEQVFS